MPDKPTYQELEGKIKEMVRETAKISTADGLQKEYEIQYRALFDSANDAIILMDRNLIFDCNKRTEELFRCSREEIVGQIPAKFWPERQPNGQLTTEYTLSIIRETIHQKIRRPFELTHQRVDGTLVDTDISLNIFEIKGKKYLQSIIRDVSERKAAQEALHQYEIQYRALFDSAIDAIILMDRNLIIDCNKSTLELFRGTKEQVIGHSPSEFWPEKQPNGQLTPEYGLERIKEALHRERRPYELVHKRLDGTLVDTDVTLNLLEIKGKKYLQSTIRDISERKAAQEALRQSEEKYRTVLEDIEDGYYEADIAGNLTFFNDSMCKIWGYPKEELMGMNNRQYADKENAKKLFQTFNEVYRTGKPTKGVDWQIIRKDGTKRSIEASVSLRKDSSGKNIGFRGTTCDVTERKHAEEQIQHMATHDALTGLPNRLMFSQLLNHAIHGAQRYQRQLAVFFIDLDRFKIVNDTMGHDAGDQLLQEIAVRLKQTLRAVDVVARLGGDEFVILIEEFSDLSQVETVAGKILSVVIKPVNIMNEECRVTASIGISVFPKDAKEEQALMKNADIAMYQAKEEGKNNYQFYSEDIQSKSLERQSIETNLRFALERNELSLHYQAQVDFKTNVIKGVEALLRWQNPYLGTVTPTQFIPIAEESGLIIPIGKWVIRTACAQNVAWQRAGLPPVCMAVNLSLRQLMDEFLIEDIKKALDDSGMAPNLLELEITESMVMHNPSRMIAVLTKIKNLGVRLAIDDFGTGYSSLAQIKHFPIDTLKVDRSFIRNIPLDAEDKAITEAIIAMGKTLSLTVVAEGVETVEQMDFLKDHSCDEMQGYYFSKPIVPEQFAELLRKNVPSPQK
jgi:diguanylate cyclase (GGDEF)-like protein/PAS domain S-box-containing protein